jgi:hypothetical protein
MPTVYSYTFTGEGQGPWWGIRCSTKFYQNTLRELDDTTRMFVYITNYNGETLAIAIEGPHNETMDNDCIFVPPWVLERLNVEDGAELMMDAILEPLPRGEMVTIRPLTGSTVDGPMFLEGLTEALSQLGVVQEGLLNAIVDPSTDIVHQFMIENLTPLKVCLADGELRVEMARAMDRPATPEPIPVPVMKDEDFDTVLPTVSKTGFVPFSGVGRRLDGK